MTQKTNPVTPLASPLGEEGHEVAKGWTVVRMIMVFLFYVLSPPNVFAVHRFDQGAADWRSGPRWSILSVLCPVHPFATTWHFPSRGNERYEGKNSESFTSGTISAFSPFGGWRHHLARWEACHWIRGSQGSPMNPVPLPPLQFGGAAKGKRLNGQARRLTSPHLEVLCRTSTVAL